MRMEEVERNLKAKQIKALTEAFQAITAKEYLESFSCEELAEELWMQGIRGVYRVRPESG